MILVALLVVPAIGALLLPLLRTLSERAAALVATAISAVAFGLAVVAAFRFDHHHADVAQLGVDRLWIAAIDVHFRLGVDGISLPLVLLTTLLVLLCCVYTVGHVPSPGRARVLLSLVFTLEIGMVGTFLALDLLLFFVFFEVVLVPMYFLINIWGGERRGYASAKFFLYTLLGSTLMLLSFLVLHARTGTFDMVALAARHGDGLSSGVQGVIFVGLFIAFAIKSPLFPLHTWLPDAHSEAPTVGSVLLAGVLLKMGTYGFIRIAVPDLPLAAHDGAPVLAVLAVAAIVYGSLCCLAQTDAKRLIAYSSVGHMGFVLLGIATLTTTGLEAALLGNVAHGLITGLLFFVIGSVKDRFHTSSIREIGSGLMARVPRVASVLTFAAIASLGLPGLAGFWGELLSLLASYDPAAGLSHGLYRTLMAFAFVGTLLTAGYFLWLLQRVTLGRASSTSPVSDITGTEALSWAPLVVMTLVLGLYPRLVLGISHDAVVGLLGLGR